MRQATPRWKSNRSSGAPCPLSEVTGAATLALPDGRTLGYATYGDAAGTAVLYCHGWPGSRLEAGLLPDLPRAMGVRLITADRPGYGLSTPHLGRTVADFAADMAALAWHLGVARASVVGVSGGGPYALALAHTLGPMVRAVALVNAVPPSAHAMPATAPVRHLMRLGRSEGPARLVLAAARRAVLAAPASSPRLVGHFLSDADRAVLTRPVLAALLDCWREGLRPGIEGVLSDARIYGSEWGFDLAAVTQPVVLWHGLADTVVPPAAVAGFAALPHASIVTLPGETHHAMPLRHAPAILARLLAASSVAA